MELPLETQQANRTTSRRRRRLWIAFVLILPALIAAVFFDQSKNEITLVNQRPKPVKFMTEIVGWPAPEMGVLNSNDAPTRSLVKETIEVPARSQSKVVFRTDKHEAFRITTEIIDGDNSIVKTESKPTWGMRMRIEKGDQLTTSSAQSTLRQAMESSRKMIPLLNRWLE